MNITWEEIKTNHHNTNTYRAKVLGGWLVKHYDSVMDENGDTVMVGFHTMTYIPDAEYQWSNS